MHTGQHAISDIKLFNQLRNLNEIRQALLTHDSPAAAELARHVEQLLENLFESSKFDDHS